MTMTLIETKTLGAAAASIDFTSIPQDGTDLLILVSTRSTANDDSEGYYYVISFNGSTANLSGRWLAGDGSTVGSGSFRPFGLSAANNATASTFSNGQIYVPNYTSSSNKSVSLDTVNENNATRARQNIDAGLWSDSSAITQFTITSAAGNLVAGSTVSLYKITKGSDGIVTTS